MDQQKNIAMRILLLLGIITIFSFTISAQSKRKYPKKPKVHKYQKRQKQTIMTRKDGKRDADYINLRSEPD